MAVLKNAIKKWYYCPYCSNYSTQPMECCGENMIEVVEEEEEE